MVTYVKHQKSRVCGSNGRDNESGLSLHRSARGSHDRQHKGDREALKARGELMKQFRKFTFFHLLPFIKTCTYIREQIWGEIQSPQNPSMFFWKYSLEDPDLITL